MDHYSVIIRFTPQQKGVISTISDIALNKYSCQGILEFSMEEEKVDEFLGERAFSGGDIPESILEEVEAFVLSSKNCYFQYYFGESDVSGFLDLIKQDFADLEVKTKKEEAKDWNEEWKKYYRPIIVSDQLSIIPKWYKKETKENEVYINPGMGFGTGSHETTLLCLQLLESLNTKISPGKKCLDFGCGSGILGISAIKRCNMIVDFCDIDKNALDNCLENLQLNFDESRLSGHRLVIRERFQVEKDYCLVFANILENILVQEKNVILSSVEKGGYLIVSGLLKDQMDSIIKKYSSSDVELLDELIIGEWGALLFRRKES